MFRLKESLRKRSNECPSRRMQVPSKRSLRNVSRIANHLQPCLRHSNNSCVVGSAGMLDGDGTIDTRGEIIGLTQYNCGFTHGYIRAMHATIFSELRLREQNSYIEVKWYGLHAEKIKLTMGCLLIKRMYQSTTNIWFPTQNGGDTKKPSYS